MQAEQFRMIAKTLHSLEEVLAKEIQELGATDIEIGRRMVSFVGDKAMLYKANLRLRTALRILKPVYTFKASNPDELYEALSRFDWTTIMTGRQTFSVDTTVYSDDFTHSKYVGYRCKDAIVDFFRAKDGTRPSVRLDNPDIYLNVHIANREVTLSLDSSGESLHKRGYRAVQTDAPINEVLAAGILLMAGWQGETNLIDPMCGSGTFLIEAALIARNIAPGIYRSGFAFERWLDYDAELFDALYNDDSDEREFTHRIYGSDILPHAIEVAKRNVARAGVGRYVELDVMPLQERPQPTEPALIVMNPPYGERLRLTDPGALYAMIGERLKHNFSGCTAWIIAYKTEHFDHIGLRQSRRVELMNGSLECELRGYELFSGKREDYKSRPREPRFPKQRETTSGTTQRQREDRSERPPRSAKPGGEEQRKGGFRSDRPSRGQSTSERKPRSSQSERIGESKHKKGQTLWPSDRFRFKDEEGRERRRPPRQQAFQVFKSEDKQN